MRRTVPRVPLVEAGALPDQTACRVLDRWLTETGARPSRITTDTLNAAIDWWNGLTDQDAARWIPWVFPGGRPPTSNQTPAPRAAVDYRAAGVAMASWLR